MIEVINQKCEIMFMPEPDAIYNLLEKAGRVCYKSEDKITEYSAKEFIGRIVRSGHESVIEHMNLTVKFITDRGVTHELVRHRLASYSQESTRYCDYGKGNMVFIRPVWLSEGVLGVWDDMEDIVLAFEEKHINKGDYLWLSSCVASGQSYKFLVNKDVNWSPQKARTVLNNSLKTEIVMTCNVREWRHVFKLRCSRKAHPQIRSLLQPLQKILNQYLPIIFEEGV